METLCTGSPEMKSQPCPCGIQSRVLGQIDGLAWSPTVIGLWSLGSVTRSKLRSGRSPDLG